MRRENLFFFVNLQKVITFRRSDFDLQKVFDQKNLLKVWHALTLDLLEGFGLLKVNFSKPS